MGAKGASDGFPPAVRRHPMTQGSGLCGALEENPIVPVRAWPYEAIIGNILGPRSHL